MFDILGCGAIAMPRPAYPALGWPGNLCGNARHEDAFPKVIPEELLAAEPGVMIPMKPRGGGGG